jgi:hypothetical protein
VRPLLPHLGMDGQGSRRRGGDVYDGQIGEFFRGQKVSDFLATAQAAGRTRRGLRLIDHS